jgi:hypothetical protein
MVRTVYKPPHGAVTVVILRNVVVTACRVQPKKQQFRGLDPPRIVRPMIRYRNSATGF